MVTVANPDAKRLYDDLLSNYNKLVRPVANVSDALTVKIKLKLSQLIDVVNTATTATNYSRVFCNVGHLSSITNLTSFVEGGFGIERKRSPTGPCDGHVGSLSAVSLFKCPWRRYIYILLEGFRTTMKNVRLGGEFSVATTTAISQGFHRDGQTERHKDRPRAKRRESLEIPFLFQTAGIIFPDSCSLLLPPILNWKAPSNRLLLAPFGSPAHTHTHTHTQTPFGGHSSAAWGSKFSLIEYARRSLSHIQSFHLPRPEKEKGKRKKKRKWRTRVPRWISVGCSSMDAMGSTGAHRLPVPLHNNGDSLDATLLECVYCWPRYIHISVATGALRVTFVRGAKRLFASSH